MNKHNRRRMRQHLKDHYGSSQGLVVVDLGSYDVNGSFKSIVSESWKYIGIDRVPGPNVDMVMSSEYDVPVPENSVDVVMSSSCLQYVRNPFKLIAEVRRILKPGGKVFICAPRHEVDGLIGLPEQLCPEGDTGFDCWRFLPEGMRAVLEDSGLQTIKVEYHNNCCWGIGLK